MVEFLNWLWAWIVGFVMDNLWAVGFAILAVVRATGITIDSGQTGLKFSFGRATKELGQGFHLLIPYLQTVRVVPTRSRTLDIPRQQVTTLDGLVLVVETTLVYRIVDVRKALIQIDDLERGMLQTFGLSVQQVLREVDREAARKSEELDRRLEDLLTERLGDWGVAIETAGFASITPSDKTLRVTQLQQRVGVRRQTRDALAVHLTPHRSLQLLGARTSYLRRGQLLRHEERLRRIERSVKPLLREGYTRSQLLQADKRLRGGAETRRNATRE